MPWPGFEDQKYESNRERMVRNDRTTDTHTAILGIGALLIMLAWLAGIAGIIYVIVHFASKYW